MSISELLEPSTTYSDAQIQEILADLNANVRGLQSLHVWASQRDLDIARLTAGANLTYIRLAGRDERGDPIVLMLLDNVWERAI